MAQNGDNHLVFVNSETGENIPIHVENDTVWVTQSQMSEIFSVGASTISQHLSNIYHDGELEQGDTLRKIPVTRAESGRDVRRQLNHYNLDAVLSVGYRVSSKRGTKFRQWATSVLRDRIEKDIQRRQKAQQEGLAELQTALTLARRALVNQTEINEETQAVLDVIERYAKSFTLLLQYDEDRLPDRVPKEEDQIEEMVELTFEDADRAIGQLKKKLFEVGEATELFGQHRGDGLAAILGNIEQTFGGVPLYPTIEIRAANLLYFIIKDHPFTDGNKRIGSFLFLHYLEKNDRLYRENGDPQINDNALVAMALLIAESDPSQRDLIIRLVMALFDRPRKEAGDQAEKTAA